jgi:hypothetical protein
MLRWQSRPTDQWLRQQTAIAAACAGHRSRLRRRTTNQATDMPAKVGVDDATKDALSGLADQDGHYERS